MLRLVPDPLREASYALGATKARVTVTVVLPAAIGGIVSGALLAVARAAGETAPLLFTILTVTTVNQNVFSGANTVAAVADLRERVIAVRRRAGPRLGRGADAHRHRLYPDDRGPSRHRTIRQIPALRTSWKSLSSTPSPTVSSRTPAVQQPGSTGVRRDLSAPGEPVFEAKNVSIYYSCFRAVTDVSLIDLRARDHRVHRPVRMRQDDRAADAEPDERPHRGRPRRGRRAVPRGVAVRQGCLPDRRAPAHRHGLPEAEPVPEVDLRQRRLRAAHQRRAQQGQAGRDRRALAAPGRALGRGEGPPAQVGPGPVRRAAAAAVHRPRARRRAGRRAHGRALLGARPDRDRRPSRT